MRRGLSATAALALAVPLLLVLAGGSASAGPPAASQRSALIVGVSVHLGGRPASPVGSRGDADAMREVLRRAGWADDQVRVLTGSAATGANIRAGIQWLASRAGPDTFSVFHYSGHVYQRTGDIDRDGEDKDEFLVPYDATSIISDRELGEKLGGVNGWLWTNISGCEAAGFNEGGKLEGPKRLFTGSSLEHEKSYERPDWRRSVYTGLLAQEGMLNGQGDANGDGLVSIQEAFRYAERGAPAMTAKQRKGVQHPYLAGGDGTEWFLKPPPPPPAPPPPPPGAPSGPQKLCLLPGLCL
ncbi:MAG: caspase family protein [Acidimicrobiales bacterium]